MKFQIKIYCSKLDIKLIYSMLFLTSLTLVEEILGIDHNLRQEQDNCANKEQVT